MERKKINCHLWKGPLDRQTVEEFPDELIVLDQGGLRHLYKKRSENFYEHVRSMLTPVDKAPPEED